MPTARPPSPTRHVLALVVCLMGGAAVARGMDDVEAFEKDVRPILIDRCGKCHGEKEQEAGLRLDSRKTIVEGGDSGPAIVPGHPDKSLLIAAVRRTGDLKMPPGPKGIGPESVAALERWIAAGAPWPADRAATAETRESHWARHWAFQPIADPVPPKVSPADWSRNPIDAFVKARLDAAGLAPSKPADRRTLIRRVTYTLTGLPPSPAEVDAFEKDPDPDAYPKLVDRLLASPHYGEHWARHWLDVARYSDTKGYIYAREERFFIHAYAYRDWIVKALNTDMPYDRFLLDQIAADGAEPGDKSALAAMGFLTLGRRFLGVPHDIIDDRIDVVTRGTMGLTVACARCHDHKFDPIPTADYYSLYGIFRNGTERSVSLADPSGADAAFEAEWSRRREALRSGLANARASASKRVRARVGDYLLAQRDLSKIPPEGFDVFIGVDDLNPAFVRRWRDHLDLAAKADDPVFRPWRRFAALKDSEFAAKAPEVFKAGFGPLNRAVAEAFKTAPKSIEEVAARYTKLFADVDRRWRELQDADDPDGSPPPTALPDPDAEALRQILHGHRSPCRLPLEPLVSTEWYFDSRMTEALWKLQGDVDRWLINSPEAPPQALALIDRDERRVARVFRRGNPLSPGDEVPPRFPIAVAGPDRKLFKDGSGRLELARAIVDPSNPLTARVWVNRVWMHHFGAGLVGTPSDFGLRAEAPSHPELLDWLARRLMGSGWSTKAIHRLILLSNTYQQSSEGTDARALRIDPENRLLWRMSPRRLSFEEWRDTALSVTGEIDLRLGGKPADLFAGKNVRRSLYGLVDRQFLPGVLRVFDFANPDLHIPTRSETTVPQQALFAMNSPFLADRARSLAKGLKVDPPEPAIRRLYRAIYQREPTASQVEDCRRFLDSATETKTEDRPESLAWSYGTIAVDPTSGPSKAIHPLPYFNGSAWVGGPQWPDTALGWAQLTAEGGHPGNDLKHATARRWTSPIRGEVAISSTLTHSEAAGDGVRAWVVCSRGGVLKSANVHNAKVDFSIESVAVEPGDTIDFVVDIREVLNSDQHLWAPVIRVPGGTIWDARRDFAGRPTVGLSPWEQLAQVFLMSNEVMFVD